jgi:bis(5'-nucleosyl)-tetraphosphatase (symmetrical)
MLRETRAEPILGNHELALLGVWRRRVVPDWAKAGNGSAYLQLEAAGRWDADMVDVSTWPEVRTGPDWIAVHAGLHPKRRPEGTDVWYLTQVRYCDAEGREGGASAHDPLEPAPGCRPWYEHYPGPRTVIFGHWARRGLVVQERVRGLDTGCVYGGQLTGLWWPDDRLEQVQALRAYAVHDDGDDGPEGVDG